jgi:hypothetical protein
MEQVLHGSSRTTEAVRRAIQHSQRKPEGACEAPRGQPEDRREVEKAHGGQGFDDRAEGPSFDRSEHRGRGGYRGVPSAHTAAARRLPLRATGDDPASDTVIAAPLPPAPWHQPLARGHWRQDAKAQVQDLPDRLFPHRHCRSSDGRGQTAPVRGDRPDEQVCLSNCIRKVAR